MYPVYASFSAAPDVPRDAICVASGLRLSEAFARPCGLISTLRAVVVKYWCMLQLVLVLMLMLTLVSPPLLLLLLLLLLLMPMLLRVFYRRFCGCCCCCCCCPNSTCGRF